MAVSLEKIGKLACSETWSSLLQVGRTLQTDELAYLAEHLRRRLGEGMPDMEKQELSILYQSSVMYNSKRPNVYIMVIWGNC